MGHDLKGICNRAAVAWGDRDGEANRIQGRMPIGLRVGVQTKNATGMWAK